MIGLWSFSAKISLALSAAIVLPILQGAVFTPAGPNTPEALRSLNLLYAVFPCALKVFALILVARLPDEQG